MAISPDAVESQRLPSAIVIRDSVACAQCDIGINHGAMITSERSGVELTHGTVFAKSLNGSLAVAELADAMLVAELGADGRFVRSMRVSAQNRTTTRGLPDVVAYSPDGSLHLFDEAYDRFGVGSPRPDLHLALFGNSSVQVHAALAFGRNTAIVQGMVPSRGGGNAFHFVAGDKGIVRSFGDNYGNTTYLEGFGATRRRLARVSNDRFLSVPPNRYELIVWDTLGTALEQLRVSSSWFRPWDARLALPSVRGARWPTVIQGVTVDSNGYLWVLAWVPKSGWSPPSATASSDGVLLRSTLEQAIESVVEIIDLECRRIIARKHFSHGLLGFIGGTSSVIYDPDPTSQQPRFLLIDLTADLRRYDVARRQGCSRALAP